MQEAILESEQDSRSLRSQSVESIVQVDEDLLPPLLSSSTELPLESFETSTTTTPTQAQTQTQTTGSTPSVPRKRRSNRTLKGGQDLSASITGPASMSNTTIITTPDTLTGISTAHGSAASLSSVTTSNSAATGSHSIHTNGTVFRKIKSGLKRLSSPLSLAPKGDNHEHLSDTHHQGQAQVQQHQQYQQQQQQQKQLTHNSSRRHVSTLSNTSNSSSSCSSATNPATKHSHTNSQFSNRTTADSYNDLLNTPLTSPVIAVNETFKSSTSSTGGGSSADSADYRFPHSDHISNINKHTLDSFDTIEQKVYYIEMLKKHAENEAAAYNITERRLLSSGWTSDDEMQDLRKRRDASIKQWHESIDKLESILYGGA